MQKKIAQAIKDYLVQLAVDDELPMDMNGLDTEPIADIILQGMTDWNEENPTCFGFDFGDIQQQAVEDDVDITDEEAKDVIRLMIRKAELPVGWETVSAFIQRYLDEKKSN